MTETPVLNPLQPVQAPPLLPVGGGPVPPLVPPGTQPPPVPPFVPDYPPAWIGPEGPPGPPGADSTVPGPKGDQGETGPQGEQGVQGEQGIQGPPGGAPAWRGEWSASIDYASNDAVSLNGSSYYAAGDPSLGVAPPAAPWQQIAAKGDQGPPGAANAAYSSTWQWNTQTSTPPNTGQVRSNTGTWTTATHLYVQHSNANNVDASAFVRAIKAGDDVALQHKTDASRWARFNVTAPAADNGTWFDLVVSYLDGGGALPNSGSDIVFAILTDGAASSQWYTGSAAPASSLGRVGDMYLQADGVVWRYEDPAGWTASSTDITGPMGATGAQGPAGATGAQGPAGATGAQGPKGDPGTAGAQGPKGDTGATGAQGPQGNPGATGNTGAQGAQGNPGATGAQGPAGPGVVSGGTTGQVLTKTSATDFATNWQTPFSQTQANTLYLALTGGTLTGPLTLPGAPTLALHAATKAYVDALAARVTTLEAQIAAMPNSIEDLTYGG